MFGLLQKLFIELLTDLVMDLMIQSAFRENMRFNLPSLSYILINTVKKFTTIYLRLN